MASEGEGSGGPGGASGDLERFRAENEALRSTQAGVERALARTARLFHLAPVACAEIGADRCVRSVNARMATLAGRPHPELLGLPLSALLSPPLVDAVATVARGPAGATTVATGSLYGATGVHEVRISATAIEADEMSAGTVLVAFEDLAQQRAADLELTASKRRYRGVFLSASDAVLLFDTTGACLEANPAAFRCFGWAADQPLPRWSDLMPPDVGGLEAPGPDARTLAPTATEVMLQTKTGPRPFEFRIAHIDADTWQIVLRDMSDFHATRGLESRLRQSEKMDALGRLAGGIVHDMNNVLAAAANYAALIADTTSDEVAAADARSILGACTRGKQITGNLLRFTRGAPEVRVRVDLRSVVSEAVDLLRHSIPKSVAIRLELPEEPIEALADGAQLMQVLVNLIMNSAQAMPEGGEVAIRLQASHGQAELQVVDTGTGIPPEHLARVMEPFYTTKPAGKGTGLGLSIAYGVIRSHNGTIGIESAPGRGTRVTITLPVLFQRTSAARPTVVPAPRAAQPPPPTSLAGRVLVVDDEPEFLRGMERILRGLGLEVETLTDGTAVVDRWRVRPFDVVVLDLDMPTLDGVTVLGRLLDADPGARVLIASGYGRERVADSVLEQPRVRYLRKPFLPGELGATLRELLSA